MIGLAGTLIARWQLLGLRGETRGSTHRHGTRSARAPEGSSGRRGGDGRRIALLLEHRVCRAAGIGF